MFNCTSNVSWCQVCFAYLVYLSDEFPVFVCFPPFVFAPSILGSLNWIFAFFHWFLFLLQDWKKMSCVRLPSHCFQQLPVFFLFVSWVKCCQRFAAFFETEHLKAPVILWRLQKCNCSRARKSKQKEMNKVHVIIHDYRHCQYKKRKPAG